MWSFYRRLRNSTFSRQVEDTFGDTLDEAFEETLEVVLGGVFMEMVMKSLEMLRHTDTSLVSGGVLGGRASRSEDEVREVLKNLTRKEFPTKRPKWLRGLELDGYNKKLRLAFEYDGEQHYNLDHYFNRLRDEKCPALAFLGQLLRDRLKDYLCARKHVALIRVPYNVTDLAEYVERQYLEARQKVDTWTDVDWMIETVEKWAELVGAFCKLVREYLDVCKSEPSRAR